VVEAEWHRARPSRSIASLSQRVSPPQGRRATVGPPAPPAGAPPPLRNQPRSSSSSPRTRTRGSAPSPSPGPRVQVVIVPARAGVPVAGQLLRVAWRVVPARAGCSEVAGRAVQRRPRTPGVLPALSARSSRAASRPPHGRGCSNEPSGVRVENGRLRRTRGVSLPTGAECSGVDVPIYLPYIAPRMASELRQQVYRRYPSRRILACAAPMANGMPPTCRFGFI
jgi:hypothetical protein